MKHKEREEAERSEREQAEERSAARMEAVHLYEKKEVAEPISGPASLPRLSATRTTLSASERPVERDRVHTLLSPFLHTSPIIWPSPSRAA